MFRLILAAGAGAALLIGCASVSLAEQSQSKLMIVNGNNHHVIYDDGRDDLFCVTRRVVSGYTDSGRPIYKRTMRCR